jgi:glyoxylase-like metal-dependent hydrolase (beta-lactamase superfamily II)
MEVVRLYYGCIDGFLPIPATPFHGYAIMHPSGVVLIDTGFGQTLGGRERRGEARYGDNVWPWVRRPTDEALADHDLHPSDVKYIINTHLGDHSADNLLFKHATAIIQQPEAEAVRKTQPQDWLENWDFAGAKLELLQGEDVEVLPGITCLFTPGHTPGHQSILLNDGTKKQLFVGDAVYTSDIWEHPEQMTEEHPAWFSQVSFGYETWKTSADKLRAADADVVHFAHDPNIIHRHGESHA